MNSQEKPLPTIEEIQKVINVEVLHKTLAKTLTQLGVGLDNKRFQKLVFQALVASGATFAKANGISIQSRFKYAAEGVAFASQEEMLAHKAAKKAALALVPDAPESAEDESTNEDSPSEESD